MSFEEFYSIFREHFKPPYPELFVSRQELLQFIDNQKRFDVVVAGGGIHGAVCARLAALSGLKVLLLERDDYASESVKRMPEFLSLALLDQGSWKLFEICKRQRQLLALHDLAPHLVEIAPLGLSGPRKGRLKTRVFAYTHQLALGAKCKSGQRDDIFTPRVMMNEPRFVLENILAARQEGAACINHACVDVVLQRRDGGVELGWTDTLNGKRHQSCCGVVLNCTGACAPFFGRISSHAFAKELKFLQEICLYIACNWKGPTRILPGKKGEFHIGIAPVERGAVVSTFLREIDAAAKTPEPTEEDIALLVKEVQQRFPEITNIRDSVCRTTSAQRTMLRNSKDPLESKWFYSQGILHLLGGSASSAFSTASRGIEELLAISKVPHDAVSLYARPLPGAWRFEEISKDIECTARDRGVPTDFIKKAISRYGTLLRLVIEEADSLEPISSAVLKGELQLAHRLEQSESVEDVVLRRLCLPILPEDAGEFLRQVAEVAKLEIARSEISKCPAFA